MRFYLFLACILLVFGFKAPSYAQEITNSLGSSLFLSDDNEATNQPVTSTNSNQPVYIAPTTGNNNATFVAPTTPQNSTSNQQIFNAAPQQDSFYGSVSGTNNNTQTNQVIYEDDQESYGLNIQQNANNQVMSLEEMGVKDYSSVDEQFETLVKQSDGLTIPDPAPYQPPPSKLDMMGSEEKQAIKAQSNNILQILDQKVTEENLKKAPGEEKMQTVSQSFSSMKSSMHDVSNSVLIGQAKDHMDDAFSSYDDSQGVKNVMAEGLAESFDAKQMESMAIGLQTKDPKASQAHVIRMEVDSDAELRAELNKKYGASQAFHYMNAYYKSKGHRCKRWRKGKCREYKAYKD